MSLERYDSGEEEVRSVPTPHESGEEAIYLRNQIEIWSVYMFLSVLKLVCVSSVENSFQISETCADHMLKTCADYVKFMLLSSNAYWAIGNCVSSWKLVLTMLNSCCYPQMRIQVLEIVWAVENLLSLLNSCCSLEKVLFGKLWEQNFFFILKALVRWIFKNTVVHKYYIRQINIKTVVYSSALTKLQKNNRRMSLLSTTVSFKEKSYITSF